MIHNFNTQIFKLTGLVFMIISSMQTGYGQVNQLLTIEKEYQGHSFTEALNEIETDYAVHFYYGENWIDSLTLNFSTRELSINQFIEKALSASQYTFIIHNNQTIYIVPRHTVIYNLKLGNENNDLSNNTIYSQEQTNYIQGRTPNATSVINIGTKENYKNERLVNITGQVLNHANHEPIIGATIFIKDIQKGAVSGIDGTFMLKMPIGKFETVIRCVGMKESSVVLNIASSGNFSIDLDEDLRSIDEVVISAQKSERSSSVGLEKISIKSVKELPSLMGEKDVVKISQMLPGIVSVSEGSAGVNVRGGNADQNLFYLNHIALYNTSHLFGFFSTINPGIINDFTIYKGYVPPAYGGRISSVFNIDTRYGSNKKFFMQGGISPISANMHLETPIIKNKLSVIVSGRSSYSDWIMNKLEQPELRNSSTSFYDLAAGLAYEINPNNSIKGFGYYSYDKFNYNQEVNYDYNNRGSSLNYIHKFSENLKSDLALSGSQYAYHTLNSSSATEAYKQTFKLEHYEFKGSFNWISGNSNNFSLGAGAILYKINRGVITPYGESSLLEPVVLGSEKGVEYSLFTEDKFKLNSKLSLTGGIRLAGFLNLGPSTVYTYNSDYPLEEAYITDTTTYASGEITHSNLAPELRAAAEYKINNFNSIKLSFTQMQQYLFMLSNSYSISPTDQWKMVDSHIKPPRSNQVSLGYYKDFFGAGVNVSSEIYYKWSENVVEYKDGADFISGANIETLLLQGNQKAYGAEFMIARNEGRLSGWISYTYSRSLITVDGGSEATSINNGKTFPSNYDKPHVCNMVATYRINRRFSFSSNLAYSTGRPITLPQSVYYIDDNPYVEYSDRNEYRVPDYFRLDLSVTIEGNLKAKKPFHSYWVASVYNVTGRSNPYSIYFKTEAQTLKGYQYSIIGVPIFTISWNIKLGNYLND